MKKALIAMSGGVDSSVAALLMQQNGYECTGATMKLFNNDDVGESKEKTCCSLSDVEDARSICYKIGIPFYVFNFTYDFNIQIIKRFVDAYEKGETPNPCIDCNKYMKFDKFLLRAKQLDIDYIATGHYARIEFDNNRYLLKKAIDESKDQSYVLYSMTQDQLKYTQFPLGQLKKSEVRELAKQNDFVNFKKHDSQDICFVRNGNYVDFIKQYTKKTYKQGEFTDINGNFLGKHKGIIAYTIGQRKGLGVSYCEPLYVYSKKITENKIVLATENQMDTKQIEVKNFNWIAFNCPNSAFNANVKIRYNQKDQPAKIIPLSSEDVMIEFETPQKQAAPGQAAVVYADDLVIGGGTIK